MSRDFLVAVFNRSPISVMDSRLAVLPIFLAGLVWLASATDTHANYESLANGGMEVAVETGNGIASWNAYTWEGDGQVIHLDGNAFDGHRAALIQGNGPGKVGLFQAVSLPPCTYRLSAMVAGYDLAPGTWGLSAQLHLAFDDNTSANHPVLTGDSGWRRMNVRFAISAAKKVTIYFFNYGSGGFFVDDVRLERDAHCGVIPVGFQIDTAVATPLSHSPPLTAGDRLLAGFCGQPDFALRAACKRLNKEPTLAPIANTERDAYVLADFDMRMPFHKPSIVPFIKTWRLRPRDRDTAAAAVLKGGTAIVGDSGSGLPANWTGYDWLEIDVENASGAPQMLTVEIRDDKTKDYWSRVNWNASVPPGRSTVYVPLQAFVGEKSVINERRRLDLNRITRLVLNTEDVASDLVIGSVRLVTEQPFKSDFPELIRLDVGPLAGPVMAGFTALPPSIRYRPERGYGLSADAKIGRVEDRRHPDDLLRDWISFHSGGLDIDLPNDVYRVWMMVEDPGYWDYYPSFYRRLVWAEGKVVLDERRSQQDFLTRYFRHANDEDLPKDDIWRRYIPVRYKPLEFDVKVTDGQLNLRFESGQDPHAVPLSALIIYPKSKAAQGEAYLAELWDRLKQGFERENHHVQPSLPLHEKPPANSFNGAVSIFQRPIHLDVNSTDWPNKSELVSQLTTTIARDERSVLMLGLYAHTDVALTSATLELPGLEQTPLVVRYKIARLNLEGTAYGSVPRVLDPLWFNAATPLPLVAGQSRSIWFDLHAPPNAKPGRREGKLRLRLQNGLTHVVPVTVDIAPWQLPPADIPVGYLGIAPTYPSTAHREIAVRRVTEMSDVLRLLQRHGFTTLTGGLGGPKFEGYQTGRVRMDYARSDRTMEAILSVGRPKEVNTYLGLELEGLPLDSKHDTMGEHKKPYARVLADILGSIREHADLKGWPPLEHSIGDEPQGEDIARVAEIGRLVRESPSKVRTSVFSSLQNPGKDASARLAGSVDRIYLNVHSEEAIRYIKDRGSDCALYNQTGRYRRGIYLLKLKALGCRGHLRFALSSVHADPWYDLDGREADYSAVFTHPDGNLRLSVDFLRYRQAVTDYRYLQKLEMLIAAESAGPHRDEAQRWLNTLISSMRGDSGTATEWMSPRILQVIEDSREHILKLSAK